MSEREGYFKELDHVTVEAWHDPNLQCAGRQETRGRGAVQLPGSQSLF